MFCRWSTATFQMPTSHAALFPCCPAKGRARPSPCCSPCTNQRRPSFLLGVKYLWMARADKRVLQESKTYRHNSCIESWRLAVRLYCCKTNLQKAAYTVQCFGSINVDSL
jgi:hypothetical protein